MVSFGLEFLFDKALASELIAYVYIQTTTYY